MAEVDGVTSSLSYLNPTLTLAINPIAKPYTTIQVFIHKFICHVTDNKVSGIQPLKL